MCIVPPSNSYNKLSATREERWLREITRMMAKSALKELRAAHAAKQLAEQVNRVGQAVVVRKSTDFDYDFDVPTWKPFEHAAHDAHDDHRPWAHPVDLLLHRGRINLSVFPSEASVASHASPCVHPHTPTRNSVVHAIQGRRYLCV